MLFVKQLLALACTVGGTLLVISQVPAVQGSDMQITGWGWLWFIVGTIAYFIAHDMVFNRIDKALGIIREADRSTLETFLFEATKWYFLPAGALLGWLVLPGAFTFVNPLGGVLLSTILGVGLGIYTLVLNWIRARHMARQNDKTENKTD